MSRISTLGTLSATAIALATAPVLANDLRLYTVGNSLTDELNFGDFDDLVDAQPDKSLTLGRHMIPGAPLSWHWEHGDQAGLSFNQQANNPNASQGYQDALGDYEWDVVTLQPYDRHIDSDFEHVGRFVNFMASNPANADTQVYIYSQWPRKQADEPFDFRSMWDRDYTGGWGASGGSSDANFRTRDYYQSLVRVLNDPASADDPNYPDIPANRLPLELSDGDSYFTPADEHPATLLERDILMIPAGDVLYRIDELLADHPDADATYGITGVAQAYSDNQHLNSYGSFVVAMTYYATIYGEDPTGLPFDLYVDNNDTGANSFAPDTPLGLEYARLVQRATWQVVNGHAFSGVDLTPGDANGDGRVNLSDFLVLRRNFGNDGGPDDNVGFHDGDFDGNGIVNLSDFLLLRANFGTGDQGPLDSWYESIVPEPTMGATMGLAGLALVRRRRR
jgi:hypothetical protein